MLSPFHIWPHVIDQYAASFNARCGESQKERKEDIEEIRARGKGGFLYKHKENYLQKDTGGDRTRLL